VRLSGNALYGTLPASWSALTSLQLLDLANNYINGTLPSEYVAWSSTLQELNLLNNRLISTIPVRMIVVWMAWPFVSLAVFGGEMACLAAMVALKANHSCVCSRRLLGT
jgi:hypothetical protein